MCVLLFLYEKELPPNVTGILDWEWTTGTESNVFEDESHIKSLGVYQGQQPGFVRKSWETGLR